MPLWLFSSGPLGDDSSTPGPAPRCRRDGRHPPEPRPRRVRRQPRQGRPEPRRTRRRPPRARPLRRCPRLGCDPALGQDDQRRSGQHRRKQPRSPPSRPGAHDAHHPAARTLAGGQHRDRRSDPGPRWLCPALAALGIGVALLSILGPLAIGAIDYHVSSDALNQVTGGDLVALVLVAPACFAAAALAGRRHPAAPSSPSVPPCSPSTPPRSSPSEVTWCATPATANASSLSTSPFRPRPAPSHWPAGGHRRRAPPADHRAVGAPLALFLLVVAGFVVIGYLPTLLDTWRDLPTRPEYLADPVSSGWSSSWTSASSPHPDRRRHRPAPRRTVGRQGRLRRDGLVRAARIVRCHDGHRHQRATATPPPRWPTPSPSPASPRSASSWPHALLRPAAGPASWT